MNIHLFFYKLEILYMQLQINSPKLGKIISYFILIFLLYFFTYKKSTEKSKNLKWMYFQYSTYYWILPFCIFIGLLLFCDVYKHSIYISTQFRLLINLRRTHKTLYIIYIWPSYSISKTHPTLYAWYLANIHTMSVLWNLHKWTI